VPARSPSAQDHGLHVPAVQIRHRLVEDGQQAVVRRVRHSDGIRNAVLREQGGLSRYRRCRCRSCIAAPCRSAGRSRPRLRASPRRGTLRSIRIPGFGSAVQRGRAVIGRVCRFDKRHRGIWLRGSFARDFFDRCSEVRRSELIAALLRVGVSLRMRRFARGCLCRWRERRNTPCGPFVSTISKFSPVISSSREKISGMIPFASPFSK
jgi:hypothetical protein